MICRKCGKDIPEDSVYCNWCGAKDDERDAVLEMLNQIRWDIEKGK